MRKLPLKLHLQFFAEDAPAATEPSEPTPPEPTTEPPQTDTVPPETAAETEPPNIETLVQKAVDRATSKLGSDNKKLKEQLDKVKREKLSTEELKQLEISDREAEIADREAQIIEKENRYYAIKAIKTAGLDTGDETALDIVDFVMGATNEDIDARVATFSKLVTKLAKAGVDKAFKDNGRIPGKGNTTPSSTPPVNIGTVLGKAAFENNQASATALNYYLGGKK